MFLRQCSLSNIIYRAKLKCWNIIYRASINCWNIITQEKQNGNKDSMIIDWAWITKNTETQLSQNIIVR